MEGVGVNPAFWREKRVLLTGHTGFKGVWAARILVRLGAEVHGFGMPAARGPSLFAMLSDQALASSVMGDIAERDAVAAAVAAARPQIVLHLAAQPLVPRSYSAPVETFAINAMGTVHLLDALRGLDELQAALVVTTDRVYAAREDGRAFVEADRLGARDPYAASKAAAELATAAFDQAYFATAAARLATARGGNVIGGGDFSADRLVPDIVRAEISGEPLALRDPGARQSWQHVLDRLAGYFAYIEALAEGRDVPAALNFGPGEDGGSLTVAEVRSHFSAALGASSEPQSDERRESAVVLAVDSGAAQRLLGWRNRYPSLEAIRLSAEWYRGWRDGADAGALVDQQIASFMPLSGTTP